jgi:NAD(P)-dependent dehydrogenase (short-subunit alcohol dehydrogenase family)
MTKSGLDGKVALVTGGASGIGAAVVDRLAAEGVSVVVVDRNRRAAEEQIASLPCPGLAVAADISSEQDVDRAVAAATDRFGRVDLHFLNAGIPGSLAPFEDLSAADFDEVIAVNLRGTFLGLRAAFRQYAAQGSGGSIVITSSICGVSGSDDLVPYHASKHGLIGLMRSAAVHGGERGVRVNAVAPGVILTPLLTAAGDGPGGVGDAERRAMIAPQRRAGTTEEVADLVVFLLSDQAGFLTGDVISIDGGATAMNPVRPSGQRSAL